jgi:uncharacterized Ntn-hydrolase superfamily protein
VVHDAVRAFLAAGGSLEDRAMAAMEAADEAGGDGRCSCASAPVPAVPCTTRTAHVAYLLAADRTDAQGRSFNDGAYDLYIDVNDQNIAPDEDINPVVTLRRRYDALRAQEGA